MKIAVVGLWHLGTITSLSLSKLNNLVYAFDNKKIIDEFNLNNPPIQENGVLELLKKYKNKNIFFNQNFDDLNKFYLIWVTYDSKIDNKDKSDFKYIFSKIKNILKHVKKNTTNVILTLICKIISEEYSHLFIISLLVWVNIKAP